MKLQVTPSMEGANPMPQAAAIAEMLKSLSVDATPQGIKIQVYGPIVILGLDQATIQALAQAIQAAAANQRS